MKTEHDTLIKDETGMSVFLSNTGDHFLGIHVEKTSEISVFHHHVAQKNKNQPPSVPLKPSIDHTSKAGTLQRRTSCNTSGTSDHGRWEYPRRECFTHKDELKTRNTPWGW